MSELITAIICTHNRAAHLSLAIRSLLDQTLSRPLYEILVVDNRSTDATAEVVREFAAAHKVRYHYEARLGLSHARNAGWCNAAGKYAAYLDDDAVAEPVWLEKALEAFERLSPTPGCVGGRITGIWEASRPQWLSDQLITGLTVLDWSDTPQRLDDLNQKWLAGANIAFPIEVLKHVGGFVPCLDRVGNSLLSGGDVFLQKQIVQAGYPCWYYPEMAVRHLVPQTRLNQQWFISRYFWQGVSDAVMQLLEQRPAPEERLRLAVPLIGRLLGSRQTLRRLIFRSTHPDRFTQKCFALIMMGRIMGLLGLAKVEQ